MNRIKELRIQKGMTQTDLCKILNVTQGNISGWETKKWQPDQESLIKLADLFDVSIDFLLGRGDIPETQLNSFSDRLVSIRVEKNMSQVEVANLLGISSRAYSNYERGRSQCDYDMLIKLSELFGVSIDYLLCKTNIRQSAEDLLQKGSLLKEQMPIINDYMKKVQKPDSLTAALKEIADIDINSLSPEDLDLLLDIIKSFLKKRGK